MRATPHLSWCLHDFSWPPDPSSLQASATSPATLCLHMPPSDTMMCEHITCACMLCSPFFHYWPTFPGAVTPPPCRHTWLFLVPFACTWAPSPLWWCDMWCVNHACMLHCPALLFTAGCSCLSTVIATSTVCDFCCQMMHHLCPSWAPLPPFKALSQHHELEKTVADTSFRWDKIHNHLLVPSVSLCECFYWTSDQLLALARGWVRLIAALRDEWPVPCHCHKPAFVWQSLLMMSLLTASCPEPTVVTMKFPTADSTSPSSPYPGTHCSEPFLPLFFVHSTLARHPPPLLTIASNIATNAFWAAGQGWAVVIMKNLADLYNNYMHAAPPKVLTIDKYWVHLAALTLSQT